MNQVSSFLENIIAVDEPETAAGTQTHARPPSSSDRSRRSTQGSEDLSLMERSFETKEGEKQRDKSGTKEKGKEKGKEKEKEKEKGKGADSASAAADPAVLKPGTVSDFWYLEDDQKKVANQLTDRIMEKVISVMLSTELKPVSSKDSRTIIHKTRPPLSVHLMSINTTQIAQKTSPVFELLDEIAFCVGWYNPWHTTGVFLMLTVLVLCPYVVTCVPPSMLLHRFLVPSYLKLFPPDPAVVDHTYIHHNPLVHGGAALGKYEPPRQISQFSREFVMNFTDLQNHMVLYIRLYDMVVEWGKHYVLFEDSRLSAVVFLALVAVMAFNLLVLPYLVPLFFRIVPLKSILLLLVWSAAAISHPTVRRKVLDIVDSEEAHEWSRDHTDRVENTLMNTVVDADNEHEPIVTKEVEVFELHVLGPNKIWEPIGFTSDFFALNHPKRHLNELSASLETPQLEPVVSDASAESTSDRTATSNTNTNNPASTTDEGVSHIFRKATLAEIKPPKYWRFAEPSWQIDLDPVRWVNSNLIMDLVNVDVDEKWVYDFVGDEDDMGENEKDDVNEDNDNEDNDDGDDDEPAALSDGQVFRRRRWIRQCMREKEAARDLRESSIAGATSSERLSKTLSTLLS